MAEATAPVPDSEVMSTDEWAAEFYSDNAALKQNQKLYDKLKRSKRVQRLDLTFGSRPDKGRSNFLVYLQHTASPVSLSIVCELYPEGLRFDSLCRCLPRNADRSLREQTSEEKKVTDQVWTRWIDGDTCYYGPKATAEEVFKDIVEDLVFLRACYPAPRRVTRALRKQSVLNLNV